MSQIIQGEGIKVFRVDVEGGKPIEVPIHELLLDLIEPVKALSTMEHALIIRDASITVPDHVINEDHEDALMQLALSIVQNAWYAVIFTPISEEDKSRAARIAELHVSRVDKFNELVGKAKVKAAPVAKVAKTPKAAKEPRVQAPAGSKPASTARIAGRLYTINPSGDVALVANLSGFRKSIYGAVKDFGGVAATFEQVLERAVLLGTTFKGADGGKNQTAYQLKELVAMNLVTLGASPDVTGHTEPSLPQVSASSAETVTVQ